MPNTTLTEEENVRVVVELEEHGFSIEEREIVIRLFSAVLKAREERVCEWVKSQTGDQLTYPQCPESQEIALSRRGVGYVQGNLCRFCGDRIKEVTRKEST